MTNKNPFLDNEELVDENDHPLDLDDFLEGGLTPRKLVATLVLRAALKTAAVEDEGSSGKASAVAVADAMKLMASLIANESNDSDSSRVEKKTRKASTPLALPPPSTLLLENILHEFENADADVARLRAELEALSYRAAEDLEAEEIAFAEAARACAAEGARVRAELAELEGRRRRGGEQASSSSLLAPAAAFLHSSSSGGSAAPDVAARLGAAEAAVTRAREASEVIRTLAALSDLYRLSEASRSGGGGEASTTATTATAAALSLLQEPLRGATAAAFSNSSLTVNYQHSQQQQHSGTDPLSEAATMAKKCLDVAREAFAAEAAAPLLPPLGASSSSSSAAAAASASADAEAGRSRLSAAVSGCELVCSHLEQVAVARFDAAAALRDARGMESASKVAASLAGSSSSSSAPNDDGGGENSTSAVFLPLIQRYVSTRPIFLGAGAAAATERSAAPSSSDASASAASNNNNNNDTPAASLTALAATCTAVAAAFEKEAPLVVEAFGSGRKKDSAAASALSVLATRLFEQKVREAVERVCLYTPTATTTTGNTPVAAAAPSSASPLRSASNASSSVAVGASAETLASSSSTAAARDAARASAEACRRVYALAQAIDACAASALGLVGKEEGEDEGEAEEGEGEDKDPRTSSSFSPIDAAAMADAVLEDSLPDQVQSELEWLRGSFGQLLASSAASASTTTAAVSSPIKTMLRQQLQITSTASTSRQSPSIPVDSVISWHSEASERVAAAAQRGRRKRQQQQQQRRAGVVAVGKAAAPSPSSSSSSVAAEAALALFAGDSGSSSSVALHPGSCVDQVSALVCSSLDAAAEAAVAAVSTFSSSSSSSTAAGAAVPPSSTSSSSPTRQKLAFAEGAATVMPQQQQQQQKQRLAKGETAYTFDEDADTACARAGLGRVLLAINQATSDLAKLRGHAQSRVLPVVLACAPSSTSAVSSALARASASAAAAAERALSSALDAHFSLRLGPLLEASTPIGVYSGDDPPDPEARPRTESLAVGVSALLCVFRAQGKNDDGGDDESETKKVDRGKQNQHFPVSLSPTNAASLAQGIAQRTSNLLRDRVLKRHAFSAAGGAMSWKADVARVSSALMFSSNQPLPRLSDAVAGLDAAASLLMVPAEALAGLIGVKGGGGGGGAGSATAAVAAAAAAVASSKSGNQNNNNNTLGAPWRDVRDTIEARLDVRGGVGAASAAASKS